MNANIQLFDLVRHFQLEGTPAEIIPFGSGHINDTYRVQCVAGSDIARYYILQRINQKVFHFPEQVMENITGVTRHLRQKVLQAGGNPEREVLNLVPTRDGLSHTHDSAGEVWRAYQLIEGARTYEAVESAAHVYQAGKAMGRFQSQLADFDPARLHETIPHFHHTPRRFSAFVLAVKNDAVNRAGGVAAEIRFLLEREAKTRRLIDLLEEGRLPLRVTHNDTKFNNVMIDDQSGESICMIDLDTVMPGTALYDFGDAVRSAAALTLEDDPDAARAGISIPIFEQLARGYLDAARGFLNEEEIHHLAFSGLLITLEQAIRFLGDYLNGDVYYKIHRPAHNLDRARTQIKMVQEMEEQMDVLEAIVQRYAVAECPGTEAGETGR